MRKISLVLIICLICSSACPALAQEKPLLIGYCESDPYVEFDTQFYYLLLGMEEYELISGVSELIANDMTAKTMWGIVSKINNPSWKINFSPDVYISLIDSKFRSLSEKGLNVEVDEMISNSGVELMLSMGTSAGLVISGLQSKTPLVNFVSADPFKSGIIADTSLSGIPDRWAHVDVDAFQRTIQVMTDVFAPKSVGVVYANSSEAYIYSGADVLDEFCRDNDITVHREFVDDGFDEADYEVYVQDMREAHAKLASEIDVYILTTSLLEEDDFRYVLEPLIEKKVPIYSINSSYDVQCGALMAAEASDFPNIGRFGADTLSRYISGEPLDALPQIYQTAPFLVINYDTARAIGYQPTFEMLLSATMIYSSTASGQEE